MDDMFIAVYSLLNQTAFFNRLVLWLGNEFFPDQEGSLPSCLLGLKQYGLEIRFRKDLGPYTKLIYALKEFPEADIITADDDLYYSETWLQELLDIHEQYPDAIIAHRCHEILFDETGEIRKYSDWHFEQVETKLSYKNFLTGVGGVLYPAHALYRDVLDSGLFMKLAPTADDVWFWAMALLNRRKIFCVDSPYVYPEFINVSRHLDQDRNACLHFLNLGQHRNDQYLRNVFQQYPQLKRIMLGKSYYVKRITGILHAIRHWIKMFLPYGLVRLYQKRTYGKDFHPARGQTGTGERNTHNAPEE